MVEFGDIFKVFTPPCFAAIGAMNAELENGSRCGVASHSSLVWDMLSPFSHIS